MKAKGWIVASLVAAGVVFASRGCFGDAGKAPDQKLASQIGQLCDIARDGAKAPVDGVRKLGWFLAAHTGDMLKQFADTVALIERIDDDKAHDKRARVAHERIFEPVVACERDFQRFRDAIAASPEATRILEQRMARVSRTIDIILGKPDGGGFDVSRAHELLDQGLAPR